MGSELMLKLLAASLLFLFQGASVSSVSDPNSLAVPAPFVVGDPTPNFFPDWNNPNGKETVDLTPLPGEVRETWIVIGQSNTTNVTDTPYVPTNRLGVQNFNISDGGVYRAKPGGAIDPLLGCTGYAPNLPSPWPNGNWIGILADLRISAGKATREIMVPIGVGGSYIHDWEPGGSNNIRLAVTAHRLAVAGLTPTGVLIGQGESDLYTLGPVYQASLQATITSIHSYWPAVRIYPAQETWINGLTSAAVSAAQAAVVNPANNVFAGPNLDLRGAAYRQSDNTHWNYSPGALAVASDWNAKLP
jgi:hypothetical protein